MPSTSPIPPPRACPTPACPPPGTAVAQQVAQTVLLVEDSRLAAEAVRLICRRAGLRLRRADSLALARRHLRVYRPDIALIDLGLPDGSGLTLIDALNRTTPRIGLIVALTGDPVLEQAALRAGADAFWEKPLRLSGPLGRLLGMDRDRDRANMDRPDTPSGIRATDCWPHQPSRNMGADPLALRDDLLRAQYMLAHASAPSRIGYAAQFLTGIARILDDGILLALAERVRTGGDAAALIAHLDRRVSAGPLF